MKTEVNTTASTPKNHISRLSKEHINKLMLLETELKCATSDRQVDCSEPFDNDTYNVPSKVDADFVLLLLKKLNATSSHGTARGMIERMAIQFEQARKKFNSVHEEQNACDFLDEMVIDVNLFRTLHLFS